MIHLQFVDETRTNLLRTTTVWKGFIVISIRSVKMAAMELQIVKTLNERPQPDNGNTQSYFFHILQLLPNLVRQTEQVYQPQDYKTQSIFKITLLYLKTFRNKWNG
jgi:hypothetical protein